MRDDLIVKDDGPEMTEEEAQGPAVWLSTDDHCYWVSTGGQVRPAARPVHHSGIRSRDGHR